MLLPPHDSTSAAPKAPSDYPFMTLGIFPQGGSYTDAMPHILNLKSKTSVVVSGSYALKNRVWEYIMLVEILKKVFDNLLPRIPDFDLSGPIAMFHTLLRGFEGFSNVTSSAEQVTFDNFDFSWFNQLVSQFNEFAGNNPVSTIFPENTFVATQSERQALAEARIIMNALLFPLPTLERELDTNSDLLESLQ